jgi:hypothetical protein
MSFEAALGETANSYRHAYRDRDPPNPIPMGEALELLSRFIQQAAAEVKDGHP